jgi:hypothetical protein
MTNEDNKKTNKFELKTQGTQHETKASMKRETCPHNLNTGKNREGAEIFSGSLFMASMNLIITSLIG